MTTARERAHTALRTALDDRDTDAAECALYATDLVVVDRVALARLQRISREHRRRCRRIIAGLRRAVVVAMADAWQWRLGEQDPDDEEYAEAYHYWQVVETEADAIRAAARRGEYRR